MEPAFEEGSNDLPKKRARFQCVIHCSDDDSNLISPQNFESWKTLLRAAEIRQHASLLDIAKGLCEGEIPQVQYHRKCRSIFTMKKLLDAIVKKGTSVDSVEDSSRRPSRTAPELSRVYPDKCIFCEKSSKYLKGQKTRETLVQCSEVRAGDQIRKAATRKLDHSILAITSRKLVAAEGHYHRSCYRAYTRVNFAANMDVGEGQEDNTEAQYEVAERDSYEQLFSYIRNEMFPNPEVLPMTDLMSRLQTYMESFGVNQVRDSTKKHLRHTLEHELAGSLHIFPNDKGKLLVYPDSLSMLELAKTTHSLKTELQHARAAKCENVITKSALQIRNEIKKQDSSQVWPPNVKQDKTIIPETLTQFLQALLSGDSECTNPSD
uniref:uncharacterized protein n=1 Tax=Myxine glutinosa TaxID=7769 RepID=UPI00358F0FB3